MKKREEKKKRRRGRREERYGSYDFGMDYWTFGLLYGNIKPQTLFFYEFGSKRTLLGILVVLDSFRLDLELFWFGFVVDLGLYGN